MSASKKALVAVVTGANRGLGLATSQELVKRGYNVIMTGRNEEAIKEAREQVVQKERVVAFTVDVTKQADAEKLAAFVKDKFGHIDTLVNNAGVLQDKMMTPMLDYATPAMLETTFQINSVGAFNMTTALLPMFIEQGSGSIVNVSSGLGQLSEMGSGMIAYRMSKAAMNVLTKVTAGEVKDTKIKVNSVCPGWVRTDMGGERASRSVEEGCSGIVWAATLGDDGPTGGFFRDGESMPW